MRYNALLPRPSNSPVTIMLQLFLHIIILNQVEYYNIKGMNTCTYLFHSIPNHPLSNRGLPLTERECLESLAHPTLLSKLEQS